jgi:hypothetical protein
MKATTKALAVLVLTDHVRAYLFEKDPKALAQAIGALLRGEEETDLTGEQKEILRNADDLLHTIFAPHSEVAIYEAQRWEDARADREHQKPRLVKTMADVAVIDAERRA